SIDHGVDRAGERARFGKPKRATISLALSRIDGGKIQLLLSDDGVGIDLRKARASAIRHGVITADEAAGLDDAGAGSLVFRSGVTTSPIITQVSGRGLGLAIVREKVEKLGGSVSFESHAG